VAENDTRVPELADPPRRDSGALRSILQTGCALGLVFASLCLAIATLADSNDLFTVVGLNRFAPKVRSVTIAALALAFVAGPALALAALVRGHTAFERLERARRFGMPLALAALLPGLFSRPLWRGRELQFLVFAGAVALLLERSLRAPMATAIAWRDNPSRSRRLFAIFQSAWLPRFLLALGIAWYFVVVSRYVLLCHARLATDSSDLAEFDNLFFNALHGHPFRAPAIDGALRDWSALKIHTEFLLYLLLPLYALEPAAESLLVMQTAIVAATAVPIYLFAARRLGRSSGVVFALVYLLWPAVERPNFFDFHFTPIGMLFVAWTIYCLDRVLGSHVGAGRRRALVALALVFVLALLSREDVAIGLAIFGLVVALSGLSPRLGLGMTLVASLYVGFVLWLKQHEGPGFFHLMYAQLQVPGEQGLVSVAKTLLTNPVFVITRQMTEVKLVYVLFMLVPLSFLWIRRWYLAMALLPGALLTLLVTDRVMVNEISFQYTYLWVPYLIAASVLGLERIGTELEGRSKRIAAIVALLFVAGACSYHYGALLGATEVRAGPREKALHITPAERRRLAELTDIARLIPRDASVAATDHEGPHVSNRLTFYSLKTTLGQKPDYVLYGRDVSVRLEKAHVRWALSSRQYGLVAERGEFRLLHRGAPTEHNGALLEALEPPRSGAR
jgi:uncharacterized membrane protein